MKGTLHLVGAFIMTAFETPQMTPTFYLLLCITLAECLFHFPTSPLYPSL